MAYRRFKSTYSRGGSSRFRGRFRRTRMSSVHRPYKWERGNFYLEFLHLHIDPERLINTVVPLAMINNLILNSTDRDGRIQAEMQRALLIGGVKFTVVQNLITFPNIRIIPPGNTGLSVSNLAGSSSMMADSKILLVSDRLVTDPTDGLATPAALESNFFTNTMPVTRSSEVQDVQTLFPTRIHWQRYMQHNGGYRHSYTINDGEITDLDAPWGAMDQPVSNTHSTGNLRLRLRLQDDEVLAWFLTSFLNRSETLATFSCEVNFKLTGTIWYRYVQ